jgi:small subunit ribosomal protein S19
MSRANWKGSYINSNFSQVKNFQKLKEINSSSNSLVMNRNSKIVPKFIGLTFKIHNGKNYIDVTVLDKMVGHKFGEFCPTRARFSFKKKKSKK